MTQKLNSYNLLTNKKGLKCDVLVLTVTINYRIILLMVFIISWCKANRPI